MRDVIGVSELVKRIEDAVDRNFDVGVVVRGALHGRDKLTVTVQVDHIKDGVPWGYMVDVLARGEEYETGNSVAYLKALQERLEGYSTKVVEEDVTQLMVYHTKK